MDTTVYSLLEMGASLDGYAILSPVSPNELNVHVSSAAFASPFSSLPFPSLTFLPFFFACARSKRPIQYPIEGKIAAVRSPDGHMIGLFESAQPTGRSEEEKE